MIRKILLTFLFLLTMTDVMGGEGTSDAEKAQSLNRQLDLFLERLHMATDSTLFYSTIQSIVKTAVQCDSFDSQPDKKGKVKIRFRNANAKRITPLRDRLLDAGLFYCNHNESAAAISAFDLYISTASSPLFQKVEQQVGQAAYFASLLSFGKKDYQKAEHYADLALRDNNYAKDAAEIKVNCMKEHLKTREDSTKYVVVLQELHERAPENHDYFTMLMDYFLSPGHEQELEQFAKDEIRKDTTNVMAWKLKGESEMKKHQWDNAISSYKHVERLDSVNVPTLYNLGICYGSKALQMKDTLVDSRGRLTKSERVLIRRVIANARDYLEKVRLLGVDRKVVDWVPPLYQVYYVLNEKEKAKKLKPLMK